MDPLRILAFMGLVASSMGGSGLIHSSWHDGERMYTSNKGKRYSPGQLLKKIVHNACAVTVTAAVFSSGGFTQSALAFDREPAPSDDRATTQVGQADFDPNTDGLDQFIVAFKDEHRSAEDREEAVEEAEKAVGTDAGLVRETADGSVVVATDQKLDPQESTEFMEKLAQSDTVDYVEPDSLVTIAEEPKKPADPNDALYPALWGMHGKWGANVSGAWAKSKGKGPVVAVLDTGIVKHPDLEPNLVSGYDFISREEAARDGNGRDADPQDEGDWFGPHECGNHDFKVSSTWHGSHVMGTIAAVGNNGQGVIGVAPEAKIQPVRVLGKCGGRTSDIADAIVWASGGDVPGVPKNQTPAQVINMSLGGQNQCGRAEQKAIDDAVARGTTFVASAGNSTADAAEFFPAGCKNVVTVTASDSHGKIISYANFGNVVDIAAPGGDIMSTVNSGRTTPVGPTYRYKTGTSMAAPHVSGVVALMKSVNSDLTPARITEVLKEKAVPLDQSCEGVCGAGLLNAAGSVGAVAPVESVPSTTPPRVPAPAPALTKPQPKPVKPQPKPVKPQPKPVKPQPKPVKHVKPGAGQPKPVKPQPKPVKHAKPKPAKKVKSKSVKHAKPKPVKHVKPKPVRRAHSRST